MAPDTDEDDSALPHSEDPSSSASDQGTCSSASPKGDPLPLKRMPNKCGGGRGGEGGGGGTL
jgi:hypothetical protein